MKNIIIERSFALLQMKTDRFCSGWFFSIIKASIKIYITVFTLFFLIIKYYCTHLLCLESFRCSHFQFVRFGIKRLAMFVFYRLYKIFESVRICDCRSDSMPLRASSIFFFIFSKFGKLCTSLMLRNVEKNSVHMSFFRYL